MSKNIPERAAVPAHFQWNTKHLYRSDKAWEAAREGVLQRLPALDAYRGTLKKGGRDAVIGCLQELFSQHRQLTRLTSYAERKHDEDTRVARYQGMREVADKTRSAFRAAAAFVEPELLSLPAKALKALAEDPTLADYSFYLSELLRKRPHVLSPAEETLLANTQLVLDAGYNAYSALCGAELEFPTIADERGKPVKLSQALFSRYRRSADRRVRKDAFDAVLGTFGAFRATFASLLSSQINSHIVVSRARKYESALAASLSPTGLRVSVYETMLSSINAQLPLLHRYLRLRQRMLGVDALTYYDLYAPLGSGPRWRFPYEEGNELLVEAMAPLGAPYCRALKRGLAAKSGWVDAYPNLGKRSGAYMSGSAYDVHPYILASYLEDYNSLSTMAHEMGHAMHSYYSNSSQPYPTADYSIFVAEVASTLNEALLMEHLLKREQRSRRKRLFLLGEQLEGFRQTMFRQALFAEFELAAYRRAEAGQPLTAEVFDALYLEITRRYYGHDEGVVEVDARYASEWAYIPHFYYNFYVFQYVSGMVAAQALAQGILTEGKPAADRYMRELLSAGDSKPSLEILRSAGVDLESPLPYAQAMTTFEHALESTEALLG